MSLIPIMDSALPALRSERQMKSAETTNEDGTATLPGLRDIQAHLNALGHVTPWTPRRDLALVEALRSGRGLDAAANAAGVSRITARNRWRHLLLDNSLDTQAITHSELRQRAAGQTDEA